jgi:predicted transcriptional regulator
MSGQADILLALESGPKTNAELQEATCDHCGSIGRYAAKLIASGRVIRVDGARGRGSKAVYALSPTGQTT